MGTLLNELPEPARLPLVERALAAIGDDGAVIILEPALRETSRALHELRDAVLARGAAHVFAPCTRVGTPCPALADPNDWCHEDRLVKLPPATAELARVTNLRDGDLKFSYLGAAPRGDAAGRGRRGGMAAGQRAARAEGQARAGRLQRCGPRRAPAAQAPPDRGIRAASSARAAATSW